jgi:hypothetical protein
MWQLLAKLAATILAYAAEHPHQAIELAKIAAFKVERGDPPDAAA